MYLSEIAGQVKMLQVTIESLSLVVKQFQRERRNLLKD